MSQQGGRPTGHEDDWWGQLYDDATEDTGPAPAADSLDDRFASAAGAVRSAGTADGSDKGEDGTGGGGPPGGAGAVRGAGRAGGTGEGIRVGATGRTGGATEGVDAAAGPGPGPEDAHDTGAEDAYGPGGGFSSGSRRVSPLPAPRDGRGSPGGGVDWWTSPDDGAPAGTPSSTGSLVPPPRGRPVARPEERPFSDPVDPRTARGAETAAGAGAAPSAETADVAPGGASQGRHRAPWEPPSETPPTPSDFPSGPLPPGFAERPSTGPGPSPAGAPTSTETAPAAAGPADSVLPPAPTGPPPTPASAAEPLSAPGAPGAPPPPTVPPRPAHVPPPSAAPTVHADGAAAPLTVPDSPAAPDAAAAPSAPAAASSQASPAPERAPDARDTPGPRGVSGPEAGHPPTVPALPALPPTPAPALKDYVGSGPPTYDPEPTALPPADPDELDDLVPDTVLDGARYGACALRAVSVRGDSARYRGEPRRDSLLTARFGTGEHALILVAMATGARATPGAHRAAAEVCQWIGRAVGRSHVRLAEDIRAARRGDLKSGLHRLTDRSLGRLRASAAEQGLQPEEYAATLRCLLLPADPDCRTRVFFGVGGGGLFRLRGGVWRDIEPRVGEVAGEPVVGFGSLPAETPEGDRLTMDLGVATPPSPYDPAPEPPREPFRFRASVARPGDTLLMCTAGFADPLRGEPELSAYLTGRWSGPTPPGLATFLADTQVRVKGYADDRTAAAVWEA
nr:protein phosphatase 2C domain-containing protein [Streptomyces sp. B4I13]